MRELKSKILIRSIPVFPVNKEMVKPKERRSLKVEVPFLDDILVSGIINFLGLDTYCFWITKAELKETSILEVNVHHFHINHNSRPHVSNSHNDS